MKFESLLIVTLVGRLNIILIKNAAPSKETLGATFGLSQSVACIARAGSPAFVRYALTHTLPLYQEKTE